MVSLGGESLEDFAFGKISGEEKARQDPIKEVLKKVNVVQNCKFRVDVRLLG